MADIDPFEGAPSLPKIVAISLQQTGHLYNFLAGDRPLRRGERVLVESEAGARVGTVEIEPHEPAQTIDLSQLRPIIRIASDHDYYLEQENLSREAHARRLGRTLLTLDTEAGSAGERLYARLGWTKFGQVPGYAARADNSSRETASFFYKAL